MDAAERVAVHDPATGALLAEVPRQGAADAERAIEAAAAAWDGWRRQTARQRATVLRRWFDLLLQHADDLALIMTAEQGKPLAEAKGEIAYGASFVEWFAEEAKRVYGETIPSPDPSKRLVVLRQPIGVCAAITPWNFPLAMITRKVAPALAAGCPVVIKPAEQTPLTALAAAELAQRAGMPPGVLNMLTSDAAGSVQIGKVLCASDVVRHLSFTGSTEVGRILMAQSAPTVKKLSLELGGNAPFIVFDDADVEAAVEGAMQSKYRNAGQTCVCANRLYVQRGVYEEFVGRLARRVAELKVGPGTSAGVQIGPLIDQQGLDKVRRHVDDALARGARLLTGGKVLEQGGGRYFEPTVLADADASMLCAREETFGPVAPVFAFDTEEQAIAAANATEFGLAAYFFSRDVARVTRVGEALEYGIVGVNTGLISNEVAPFGGVKQSGLGREGSHHGIDEYLELKYLCVGGIGA
ncbi:MAG: NAD-dependent succinate-semialdehyde dehydrogenase [Betaproteobacteria bacterium]|nr:NAD-dependent succinate-semialdehyde dehydrogenase [Betaproteobacteria bacterium]MBU6511208.1 NAD-dependent succinate-semialdehyde dehydrogenase [Betaproteobacteria bacterium]MDE1956648.1 NAD-dependent succinate-semialdehyde dehydrogenase [Betaproteobacteria bacterium]MDE2151538.1 NAD-dependent succinate-semialdehyde dehydrogenase [Betaproteobacteria bacterium]MDE2478257.1 NAD-dependent succinate-semialdehyde dehydrogenase [Betaproteobacteria bacterium]